VKDLNRVYELSKQLSKEFHFNGDVVFQADIKLQYSFNKEWRFDLFYPGSFSAKDLKIIDTIAREIDCYYEIASGKAVFALTIPYKESQDD
jgi:glutathionyl-hydroquinone reductase